jgi:hypothetical protein
VNDQGERPPEPKEWSWLDEVSPVTKAVVYVTVGAVLGYAALLIVQLFI